MSRRRFITQLAALGAAAPLHAVFARSAGREIAYITPSLAVSFWQAVSAGIGAAAKAGGYQLTTLESDNNAAIQLRRAEAAIARGVAGIVLSPVDSVSAPGVLALAEKAGIPVVICDIGTTGGHYAAMVSCDNRAGARGIGDAVGAELKQRGWTDGSFGIIAIPQARKNGQMRTQGFRDAMAAAGVKNEAPMQQMKDFTADESSTFAHDMLHAHADLRAIFVQADDQAIGVALAVKAERRADSVLVAAFDGSPELLAAITDGRIVGSGMQQPYLMGAESTRALALKLAGGTPAKDLVVPILVVTAANASQNIRQIKLNVFADAG